METAADEDFDDFPGTVCVVGLGLMGSSLARAYRAAGLPCKLTGVVRSPSRAKDAMRLGVVDEAGTDLGATVATADMVILAAPARAILHLLPIVGTHARPGTIIIDLGSTKMQICRAMEALPDGLEPIGGHPMCGKETSGMEASDPAIFVRRKFVLCPLARTSQRTVTVVRRMAEAIGSIPLVLDPSAHDRAVAAISHLPYLAATALIDFVAAERDAVAWDVASSGFRDSTRLASSDVAMMLDILMTNRENIAQDLDDYIFQLVGLRDLVRAGDEAKLAERLRAAASARAAHPIA